MFLRCFNEGNKNPKLRPRAIEWLSALEIGRNQLLECEKIEGHYYNSGYGSCYWCERARDLGVDIFPGIERVKPIISNTTNMPQVFSKLNSLLQAQNFEEADLETRKIMLAVAKREKEGWLRIEDAEKFPCKELRSIDQLWLKYSRGKFGISVQQQIYQSLGGTKEYN